MQADEAHLLQLAREGNRQAFGHLVTKYQSLVFTVALRLMKQREEAEEVAQDAFVKAWQQLPKYEGKARFSTWLYRITFNTAVSRLRKHKPTISWEEDGVSEHLAPLPAIETAMDGLKSNERSAFIQQGLAKLSEIDSTVLTLFYLAENDTDEIASITGLSLSNVKVRLMRARKRLYVELEKLLKDELQSIL